MDVFGEADRDQQRGDGGGHRVERDAQHGHEPDRPHDAQHARDQRDEHGLQRAEGQEEHDQEDPDRERDQRELVALDVAGIGGLGERLAHLEDAQARRRHLGDEPVHLHGEGAVEVGGARGVDDDGGGPGVRRDEVVDEHAVHDVKGAVLVDIPESIQYRKGMELRRGVVIRLTGLDGLLIFRG